MKRVLFICGYILFVATAGAQKVSASLAKAFAAFERDPQLKSAIASLYVLDARTGKVVFEQNASTGLAPASTLKIITSITAYELLGHEYRYKTTIGYDGTIGAGVLKGNLCVTGSGDPTLGSWRFPHTKEEVVMQQLVDAVVRQGIKKIDGAVIVDERLWGSQTIPDGWIWQDIGNYYGAGASAFNWRENQFDVVLRSGSRINDPVQIVSTTPKLYDVRLQSELCSAAKGSGDNAYIYLPPYSNRGIIRGSIPVAESRFTIAGALPNPAYQFSKTLAEALAKRMTSEPFMAGSFYSDAVEKNNRALSIKNFFSYDSPSLDSIVYWLNRKSINLYAEALLKTMAYEKTWNGTTEKGVQVIKDFWKSKGIDDVELNMVDGSGLSPLNRVTTRAQVRILQYAQKQTWFKSFYESLPEFNGMKMKSGTISGAKGFAGYHRSASGDYIFSFIVNNYNGSSGSLVQKMYKVLDVLK